MPRKPTEAVTRALTSGIDKVVESRYEPAVRNVVRVRSRRSEISESDLAHIIVRRYRRELGTAGAASGGAAAVPGVGTSAAVATSLAETSWTAVRLGQMILEIGIAYGHTAEEIDERRLWVLAVLGSALGISESLGETAGLVGRRGGIRIVKAIPIGQIQRVNRAIGGRVVVKWGATQGAVRLGTLIPFGAGALIGGGGNAALVMVVGRQAKLFFDDGDNKLPPGAPDGLPSDAGVIDAEAVEEH